MSAHRYCEACGDCLICYEEDRCYGTDDGMHIEPRGHEEDGEGVEDESSKKARDK